MKIKFWGTRGSIPSPKRPIEEEEKIIKILQDFNSLDTSVEKYLKDLPRHIKSGYGADTTCVQVSENSKSFYIDAGSGLRHAGIELMSGYCAKGSGEVHIYFTHFHWDHLLGLPFFIPLFIPGNTIHLYSADPFLEEAIRTIFKKPFFPVAYEHLGASIFFHSLRPRENNVINSISVTPYLLDHPDPCWGLKVTSKDGKTYSHCVDNECKRVSATDLDQDLPLYQDLDLLYFDAQYTMQNLLEKVDWGHSSSFIGVDIAMRENIKKIIFTHHDPMNSDEQIEKMKKETKKYFQMMEKEIKGHTDLEWEFAYDGMEIEL